MLTARTSAEIAGFLAERFYTASLHDDEPGASAEHELRGGGYQPTRPVWELAGGVLRNSKPVIFRVPAGATVRWSCLRDSAGEVRGWWPVEEETYNRAGAYLIDTGEWRFVVTDLGG